MHYCIIEQIGVRSISLCRYALKDSIEISFIFSDWYCIFYAFFKFI
jgi:hypothetical protein